MQFQANFDSMKLADKFIEADGLKLLWPSDACPMALYISVSIDSGNGLLSDDVIPSSETMLIHGK